MDAQTFIEKDSKKLMAEFYKAYDCDFQSHDVIKKSDSVAVKEQKLKIFFDKIRYKIFLGKTKDDLIKTLQWDRFPIATVKELEENCVEVDDVITVNWYGERKKKGIGIEIVYIIKDNKVISHYTHCL
jgi:hypothetical protein